MKTILLNGSPKGNVHGCGSYFLATAFVSKMKRPCEIRSIEKEDRQELLAGLRQADQIILIAPNYIHSLPAGTLDFINGLPAAAGKQSIGFIVQSGYPESSESELICRFLKRHVANLGYGCLGAIVKGNCAGLAIMPQMFDKLASKFAEFGRIYEQTGNFDPKLAKEFAKPYLLSKFRTGLLSITNPIGNRLGWHKIMKENHAFSSRLDMPYLDRS